MKTVFKSIILLSLVFSQLGLFSKKQAFVIDDNLMKAEYNLYKINALTDPNSAEEYLENYFYVNDDKSNTGVTVDDKGDCRLDKSKLIYQFNKIRTKHQVPYMKWNKGLEDRSYKYLEELKKKHQCVFKEIKQEVDDFDMVHYEGPERLTESELLQKWYKTYYALNPRRSDIDYFSMALLVSPLNDVVGCSKICCYSTEMYICLLQPKAENRSKLLDDLKPNIYLSNK